MKNVLLALAFWDDNKPTQTRLRNCLFSYAKYVENVKHLGKENYRIDVKLFDFSPKKLIPKAIHIPYPLAEYRHCEKLNEIIFKYSEGYDVMCMADSDTFFLPDAYAGFNKILNNIDINKNHHYFFNLHDIDKANIVHVNFETLAISPDIQTTERFPGGASGTFGGVYISPMKFLIQAGGYNNALKHWGNEDGDMYTRVDAIKPFSYENASSLAKIYHLGHDTDWGSPLYYKQ